MGYRDGSCSRGAIPAMGLQWACNGVHPLPPQIEKEPYIILLQAPLQAHCKPIAGPLQDHCRNCFEFSNSHCRITLQIPWRADCGPIAGPLQAHHRLVAVYIRSLVASSRSGVFSKPTAGPFLGLISCPLTVFNALMEYARCGTIWVYLGGFVNCPQPNTDAFVDSKCPTRYCQRHLLKAFLKHKNKSF